MTPSSRAVRYCAGLALLPLVGVLALLLHSLVVPFPRALERPVPLGQRILDRDGLLLARTMASDGVFRAPISLADAGEHLPRAVLAAEDKRFYRHLGVDPTAILRAGVQALLHGKLVSGASTITQQLARTTFQRPRTLLGKWQEMALALRIERTLGKNAILEHYLNRVAFGPRIIGAGAAADHYFGKRLSELSLAEAATIAGLVRGPSLYDPRARAALAQRRRDRVLLRMAEADFITEAEAVLGQRAPLRLLPRPPIEGAEHWVRQVGRRSDRKEARTTLFSPLQSALETLVAGRAARLGQSSVTAASVVVLDNASGDVLAWVGSPDFDDERDGQNDGVVALRQPGSTLKPFLYAMGIEELGMTTATFLPDEPTQFRTNDSFYEPRNYDRAYRGQVRLARALSNSLNVPAVHMISRLGVGHVLSRLRQMGLEALDRDADHYGPALALGDGEVTLLQLTAAYAMLARGGRPIAPRFLLTEEQRSTARVLGPETCALISEILSDDAARREAFGSDSALDLPFPVAVKTGTSKGYRDSWTVGYTRGITVGVWVGNFDGSPTERVTGARGAGPLFHQTMETASLLLGAVVTEAGKERPLHDVPLRRLGVCGSAVTPSSSGACGPGQRKVLYWYSAPESRLSVSTSERARRTQAEGQSDGVGREPLVSFPVDGMVFHFDPATPPERQRLVLRSRPLAQTTKLLVDDELLVGKQGRAEWVLRPGRHRVVAIGEGGTPSRPVEFFVR